MSPHQKFIEEAIELSRVSLEDGQSGPFGAVVVKDHQIIGRGSNQVVRWKNPTAHAEMVAIRDACKTLGTFELSGASIYTSCEPCPMCLAAIYWARINSIYFAATREDAATAGFDDLHIYHQIALPHDQRDIPLTNLSRPRAAEVFARWRQLDAKIEY